MAYPFLCRELTASEHRHDMPPLRASPTFAHFSAMNPNGTIPVLRDPNLGPLWETGAICRYLATRYGSDSFWPGDVVARADVDRWAEWAKLNVAMAFTVPIFWRVVRTPKAQRDQKTIQTAVDALEQKLAIADTALATRSFIVGDELTLADIQFGHILFRYYDIGIRRADLPNVQAYYKRLAERPAFREHVMLSYNELKVD
ncbi:glutathione S-transferase family protein [Aestuariicoccus sp. MJ-SS9]|uniref:glutathione S-transferase family protein n=1 Tax=Aestuariicoccus sp. MJ-SS9 TaxID=3079855 RepID=UPI0029134CC8|nr:glutathione binding-like protein [Aestuariicoccus sp. MJ-SS9]MDU8912955.1 glutathione binding-like protein [Aestuariicoccus sp. MJ-SS9]